MLKVLDVLFCSLFTAQTMILRTMLHWSEVNDKPTDVQHIQKHPHHNYGLKLYEKKIENNAL